MPEGIPGGTAAIGRVFTTGTEKINGVFIKIRIVQLHCSYCLTLHQLQKCHYIKAHLPRAELLSGGLEEDGAELGADFFVLSRSADGRAGSRVASFWVFAELLLAVAFFFLLAIIVSIS